MVELAGTDWNKVELGDNRELRRKQETVEFAIDCVKTGGHSASDRLIRDSRVEEVGLCIRGEFQMAAGGLKPAPAHSCQSSKDCAMK